MTRQKISEVTHFEIPARDMDRLRAFYTDVFGWKFKNTAIQDMQYWTITTGTKHIPGVKGGMYRKGSKNQTPINYISTPDLEETMAKVEMAGGHVTVTSKEIAKQGWTAVVTDPEGNSIGLFQSMDRGWLRQRGVQNQSGEDRVRSSHRNNQTEDSR